MSQQLNLFNPVFLKQKKYFSSRTMLLSVGILLLAFVLIYSVQLAQLSGFKKQLEEANAQYRTTQEQLTKFAAAAKRTPSQALEDEVARLEAQLSAQNLLLEKLDSGELGNTEGFSAYLAALARQTLPGVWLTGFSANGIEGPQSIRGRMLRPELLPTYLRMLNKESALRGHGFSELQLSTREEKSAPGPSYVEFTLGPTESKGGAR